MTPKQKGESLPLSIGAEPANRSAMIPQASPARRLDRYRGAIDAAIRRVMDRGCFLLGEETSAFEEEWACYLGARHAVAVSSGAAALTMALSALGIGGGDEVVTSGLTAVPTATAIRRAGATPVFADVDPGTRNLDPAAIESVIGPRTAAIVPVHLHGVPADMDAILRVASRHGLRVIEDCAQSHGATIGDRKLGTFGDAAAFSFYPTKNLGAAGDAGALVTSDSAVAEYARRARSHGLDEQGRAIVPGETGRIDELQAAILRALLPHLDQANSERRVLAEQYRLHLADMDVRLPPEHAGAVYHQFAIVVSERDQVMARMEGEGVLTGVHYRRALHQHPAFARAGLRLPAAERLCAGLLSLPVQPEIATGCIERIVDCLRRSLAG
jgi:dTDP-4-amino-4,6-dideoxygalactose transaminase